MGYGMDKNQAAWIKIVKPVAIGLVGLMSVAAGYLQYLQTGKNDKMESRMTAIEVRMDASDKRQDAADRRSDKFGSDIDNFKVLLGDIRSDVSYIRGKMEAGK